MTEIKVNQTLDLKNTSCPINFVKTKLKLEEMNVGEVLEVILDDGDPITNVTASIKEEGHQILKVEQMEPTRDQGSYGRNTPRSIKNYWKLVVKKA